MVDIKLTDKKCFYCRRSTGVKDISLINDDCEEKRIYLCRECIRWIVNDLYKDGNFSLEIR